MPFFVIFGLIIAAASVGVVASRKPIHSALFLLANFATLPILYILLEAQFLRGVQHEHLHPDVGWHLGAASGNWLMALPVK